MVCAAGCGGAPASKPENTARAPDKIDVISEALVYQIADGKLLAERFIDPRKHVVHYINVPGAAADFGPQPGHVPFTNDKLCGAAAATTATAYIKQMVAHEKQLLESANDLPDYKLTCHGVDSPKGSVECRVRNGGEYDQDFAVYFVPDPDRGFRLAALFSFEGGAQPQHDYDALEVALAAPSPCK